METRTRERTLANIPEKQNIGGKKMKAIEKDILDQLVEACQELSKNQAQVRRSYSDLMEKLNERLKDIPVEGPTLYYIVHEWDYQGSGDILRHHEARLVLHLWEEGAYLELEEGWQGDNQWHTATLVDPSVETMWAVGENLGEALSFFLEEVRRRSSRCHEAIGVLTEMAHSTGG